MVVSLGFGFRILENPEYRFNCGNFGYFCIGLEDCANLIGFKSCKLKYKLSQVINSRKSEVDPQGIDEENCLR